MGTWYIAKTGNDTSGNGTSGSPWKTLNKAVESVPAGTQANPSVIIVKNGTYNLAGGEGLRPGKKNVVVNKPWITIKAETMRQAILHGDMEPGPPPRPDPANLNYIGAGPNGRNGDFITIARQGICIDGLTIECVGGAAIGVGSLAVEETLPDDITVQNNATYWTMGQGVNVFAGGKDGTPSQNGKRTVVRNNRCVCGSVRSITSNPQGGTPDPSTAALRVGTTESGLVENNIVEHSFGEGLDFGKYSAGTPSAPCILRGNIVHDSSHAALYLVWNRHVHAYNNIVYHTKNSGAHSTQSPYGPGNALAFRDEGKGTPEDINGFGSEWSTDYYVYNNLAVNGDVCFQEGGQRPVYFGFNTLVTGWFTFNAAVIGDGRTHGIFENNVIVDAITARRPIPPSAKNVTSWKFARSSFDGLRPNAWSYQPDAAWRKAGDIYGTTSQSGPVEAKKLGLVNPTRDLVTTGWGWNYNTLAEFDAHVSDNFNVADYHLLASSPARDRAGARVSGNGITVPLLPFQTDYRGATRSVPDMGFHEASGQITVHVEANFSATPGGTALETGTAVSFANESVVTGTTVTSYTWTVKKGTATQATAATTNFSYTFPSAGSYTVTLLVTTPEGNDSHVVSYTITDPTGTPTVEAVIGRSPSGLSHEVGATIAFTDNSTYTLASFVSRQWEVRTSPGGVLVASSTLNPWSWQFLTAGTFTAKLTVNATGGLSDSETLTYTISAPASEVTADFTASDADLIIEEGEAVTFTNTSTAEGTTITGYTWTVTRLGIEQEFSTTNLTYAFPTAGLWTVRLRATAADGTVAEKSVAVIVQTVGGPVGGATFMVAPHVFALPTTTGSHTITCPALGTMTPKGVHLKVVGATAAGTAAADSMWSEGAAQTGNQWSHARFSADGLAAGNPGRIRSEESLFIILGAGGVEGQGALVRFVPGGMEIDITDAPAAAYLAEATFYAGDDCQFAAGSSVPGTRDETSFVTTGFRPDAVYCASSWTRDERIIEADADMSRGWAVEGNEGIIQAHTRNEDQAGQDPTVLLTRLNATHVASSQDGTPGYTLVSILGFESVGFRWRPAGSTISRPLSWFAVSTGGARVALMATPDLVMTTVAPLPLPWPAQTVMALTTTMAATSAQLSGADAEGQGWYIISANGGIEYSLAIASDSGAATTDTWSFAGGGFRGLLGSGGDAWAGTGTLAADGLSMALSTTAYAPYRMIVIAFEEGETVVEPVGPIADFTAEFESEVELERVTVWFDSSISNGNGEEILSYAWQFGDGATSTEANPFHVYQGVGEYTVTLTVTTAVGSDSKTKARFVTIGPAIYPDELIGMSPPATSGGHTGNAFSAAYDHTHFIAGPWVSLEALTTAAEVQAFVDSPGDGLHARMAWDEVGRRVLIQTPDGVMRQIATTEYT